MMTPCLIQTGMNAQANLLHKDKIKPELKPNSVRAEMNVGKDQTKLLPGSYNAAAHKRSTDQILSEQAQKHFVQGGDGNFSLPERFKNDSNKSNNE